MQEFRKLKLNIKSVCVCVCVCNKNPCDSSYCTRSYFYPPVPKYISTPTSPLRIFQRKFPQFCNVEDLFKILPENSEALIDKKDLQQKFVLYN